MRQRRPRHHHRGTAYVLFLGASMLVLVAGLSSLTITRIQIRSASDAGDVAAARFYARSAVELGLSIITRDVNWATNKGEGMWFANVPIGSGTMSLEVTILGVTGKIRLDAWGAQGDAVHGIRVTLMPAGASGEYAIEPGSWKQLVAP